jgi:hypothetical protein
VRCRNVGHVKQVLAGALAAMLVGSVGGLGPKVATSDPGFPWLPATPSPVGDAATVMGPVAGVDPTTREGIENTFAQIRAIIGPIG